MYRRRVTPAGGMSQGGERQPQTLGRGGNVQGENRMSRYSGPDARPANMPQQGGGAQNIRAMLTQRTPQPNQQARDNANPNAAFMGQPTTMLAPPIQPPPPVQAPTTMQAPPIQYPQPVQAPQSGVEALRQRLQTAGTQLQGAPIDGTGEPHPHMNPPRYPQGGPGYNSAISPPRGGRP